MSEKSENKVAKRAQLRIIEHLARAAAKNVRDADAVAWYGDAAVALSRQFLKLWPRRVENLCHLLNEPLPIEQMGERPAL